MDLDEPPSTDATPPVLLAEESYPAAGALLRPGKTIELVFSEAVTLAGCTGKVTAHPQATREEPRLASGEDRVYTASPLKVQDTPSLWQPPAPGAR